MYSCLLSKKARSLVVCSFISAYIEMASGECLSLKDSQACPGYKDDFVSTRSVDLFTWYPENDVKAFDTALLKYIGSQRDIDQFQVFMRCEGYKPSQDSERPDLGLSIIKYRRSVLCSTLIGSAKNIRQCYLGKDAIKPVSFDQKADDESKKNQDGQTNEDASLKKRETRHKKTIFSKRQGFVTPKPLCMKTCMDWVDSLSTIAKNTTLCQSTNTLGIDLAMKGFYDTCKVYPLNGVDNCVSGDEIEVDTCGYRYVEDWCSYCKYSEEFRSECAQADLHSLSDSFFNGEVLGKRKSKSSIPKANIKNRGTETEDLEGNQDKNAKGYRDATIVLGVFLGLLVFLLILMWLLRRWGGGKNNKMLNRLYMWGKKPVLGGTDNAFNYSGAQEKMLKGGIGYLDSTKGVDLKNVDSNEKTLEYDFVDMFLECVGKPREVHSTFFANREDEIGLKVGEKVLVQIAFDDGWAVGKNTNTDEEGTFPLACLFRTPPLQLPNAWTNLEASRINSDGNSVNESVENSPMSKTIKSESYKRDYSSTRIKTNNATGVDDKKSVMCTNLNHGLVYTFKNTNTAPIGNGGQYEKKPMHLGLVDSRQEYNGLNTKSREIPSDKETQANVTFDNSSSNISTILKINDESIATNGSRVGINSSSGIQKLQPAILNKSISKIKDTFSGPRSPMKQSVRRAESKGKAEKIVGEDSEQINKQMDTQGTSGFFTDMEYMENNSNVSSSSNESFVNHSTDTQDDKNQLEQHELGVGFDDFPTPVLQNLRLDTIDKKGSYELGKILQTKKSKTSVGNVVNSSSDGVLKNFKVA